MSAVAAFQEKSGGGGKKVEFAEYFKRNTCTRQILRTICRFHVLFMRKGVQENRDPGKKVIFLSKNYVSGLWFHYFCRKFAYSMAPGGTLPPCPLIAATVCLHQNWA